jgi:hypothetical protein
LGPEPPKNPGPPFAVGDIIMCDVRGTAGLQRAFVLSADHPKYRLCLEEGKTVGTHIGKAWMAPRWAPGEFAPDQDDPFREERGNGRLKLGSYGTHMDSQLELLRKIKEAKEFAKAGKADDAAVPT